MILAYFVLSIKCFKASSLQEGTGWRFKNEYSGEDTSSALLVSPVGLLERSDTQSTLELHHIVRVRLPPSFGNSD
jgi:hypothetical protein